MSVEKFIHLDIDTTKNRIEDVRLARNSKSLGTDNGFSVCIGKSSDCELIEEIEVSITNNLPYLDIEHDLDNKGCTSDDLLSLYIIVDREKRVVVGQAITVFHTIDNQDESSNFIVYPIFVHRITEEIEAVQKLLKDFLEDELNKEVKDFEKTMLKIVDEEFERLELEESTEDKVKIEK